MLVHKYNKKNKRREYALVSKSRQSKVLKWFGPNRPSKSRFQKEERRVHAFAGR
jgi:hypothetical protein